VHFYSALTGVSIELPIGFEQVGADEASVTYAYVPDPDESSSSDAAELSRLLRIRVVGHVEAGASEEQRRSAAVAVADGFAEQGEVVRPRASGTVDSEPFETLAIRHDEQGLLYVAVLAGQRRLLTLTGAGADDLGLWDSAADTIRVIEL
jgi:hypothetical protein